MTSSSICICRSRLPSTGKERHTWRTCGDVKLPSSRCFPASSQPVRSCPSPYARLSMMPIWSGSGWRSKALGRRASNRSSSSKLDAVAAEVSTNRWHRPIRLLAAGRVLLGLAASVARPAWLEWLFGKSARGAAPVALARMAGARDGALGVATLAAARDGSGPVRRLALLSGCCDAADAAIGLTTPGLSRRARTINATAATVAALVGMIAASQRRLVS